MFCKKILYNRPLVHDIEEDEAVFDEGIILSQIGTHHFNGLLTGLIEHVEHEDQFMDDANTLETPIDITSR